MVKHGFRVPSPSEVAVKCGFLVYRNRVETETDLLTILVLRERTDADGTDTTEFP
jgi:hypothetical protein